MSTSSLIIPGKYNCNIFENKVKNDPQETSSHRFSFPAGADHPLPGPYALYDKRRGEISGPYSGMGADEHIVQQTIPFYRSGQPDQAAGLRGRYDDVAPVF